MIWLNPFLECWCLVMTLNTIMQLTGGEVTHFGVLQCRDLCLDRFGCASVNFSVLTLSCQLIYSDDLRSTEVINVRLTDDHSIITLEKGMDPDTSEATCSKRFRLFWPHKGRLLCRPYRRELESRSQNFITPSKKCVSKEVCIKGSKRPKNKNHLQTDEDNKRSPVYPRILIFSPPRTGQRSYASVHQVDLQNLSISSYRQISLEYPVAAAFIATKQLLVIVRSVDFRCTKLSKQACKLQVFRLGSSQCLHTKDICVGYNLAVDQSKGFVFLPSNCPFSGVMVLTTDMMDLKQVVGTKSNPEAIAVDQSKSMIFVSIPAGLGKGGRIVQYYYNGTIVDNILVTDKTIQSWMTFDSLTNALYFQVDTKIHMFFPSNASNLIFKDLRFKAISLHVIGGDIYFISFIDQRYFRVLKKNGFRKRVYIRSPSIHFKTSCLVM